MTYAECLEFCTKRMAPLGYFPHEIAAAAKNEWIIYENEMLYQMEELINKQFLTNPFEYGTIRHNRLTKKEIEQCIQQRKGQLNREQVLPV